MIFRPELFYISIAIPCWYQAVANGLINKYQQYYLILTRHYVFLLNPLMVSKQ